MKSFKYILIIYFLVNIKPLDAQVFLNGANLHATTGSLIYVNTDSLLLDDNALFIAEGFIRIDQDLVNNDGLLQNSGTIDIENDVINNDILEGFNIVNQFFVQGNWINNSLFTPGMSEVILDGAIQDITGSTITNFYNLTCLGNLLDLKQLVGIDANVLNNLDLTDVEFATNLQNLSVLNPALNAIEKNEGFVSSLGDGRLNRTTNSTNEYLFPVGSSLTTLRYRPIIITPEINNLNTYGVRLANLEATNEGYDIETIDDSLCLVNPEFYHRIYGNEQADIRMHYIPDEDGIWTDMAHWEGEPEWTDMGSEIDTNPLDFNTLTIQDWSNFTNPAFALAIRNATLEIGDNIETTAGNDVNLSPIYVGPPISSMSWTPSNNLDCEDCLNPIANLNETTELILTINEDGNCSISDSITITILQGQVFLPTGFSPNGDGTNDYFRPLNENIELWQLQVWNRWGELIFSTDDYTVGWNGYFKGQKQGIGVYTYAAEYQLEGQTKQQTLKGNITLIR